MSDAFTKEMADSVAKAERERIIKLLEEQDLPLSRKLAEVPSGWESQQVMGMRLGLYLAKALIQGDERSIALIKGEN